MHKVQARIFRCSPAEYDWKSMLQRVAALNDRYLERGMGKRWLAVPLEGSGALLSLWSLRPGAQVDLHDNGQIKPWDLSSDLAEGSYFLGFEDGTVVIASKGHGPRPSALSQYLDSKLGDDVDFDPVLRDSTGEYVASIDDARKVMITVDSPAAVAVLREADPTLGDSVASLMETTGGTRLVLELTGRDREEKLRMWDRVRHFVRQVAERADVSTTFRKFRIVVPGEIAGSEEVDLLKDRISYQIPVDVEGLQPHTAEYVLQAAYDRFHADFG